MKIPRFIAWLLEWPDRRFMSDMYRGFDMIDARCPHCGMYPHTLADDERPANVSPYELFCGCDWETS